MSYCDSYERLSSETHSLCGVIAGRRSIRRYRTDEVPAAILQRLLQAAVAAPSAHNRQPWRFTLLPVCGDVVRYVVNRNINYTNICHFHCQFCAFSKGKTSEALRGAPYDLALSEIVRRAREAWARGATEVCMQGGIHPDYTGATYLAICRAVKRAVPLMHIHAF